MSEINLRMGRQIYPFGVLKKSKMIPAETPPIGRLM
jgi:hypothetical protein